MEATPKVVDVDDSVEAPQVQYNFVVDRTKAGLHGITEEEIARSARMFLGGESPTIVHQDTERSPLEVNLRLPRSMRSRPEDMGPIRVKATDGSMVPFNEVGRTQGDDHRPDHIPKEYGASGFCDRRDGRAEPCECDL